MIHEFGQWCEKYLHIPGLPVWASILVIGIGMAAVSIALTAVALIFIPEDYFTDAATRRPPHFRHPFMRWSFRILHNVIGWGLIGLGIILMFPGIPGQGLLTVLLGVMLAEFPGKRRLEMKIIRMEHVFKTVNRLRAKFGKPPLIVDGSWNSPNAHLE